MAGLNPLTGPAAAGEDWPLSSAAHAGPPTSVIICGYTMERWDDLRASVESVRAQTLQPLETLVVIDHNPELLASARMRLGRDVTVLASDGSPGLSGARNAGLAAAAGEVVAFLDDDARAEPEWLARLVAPYEDPLVMAVGGRIVPSWDTSRPAWFPAEFDWVLGCTYRGTPHERCPVRNVIGANMSFRTEALRSVGGFASELGRTATRPLGAEETEACIRVRQQISDAVVLYEPYAVVAHRVPASRTTWRYFRRRCFGEGLSKATLTGNVGGRDGLSAERTHALRTLPRGALRAIAAAVHERDPQQLDYAAAIGAGLFATAGGYAVGMLKRGWRWLLAPASDPAPSQRPRVLMVTPRFPPYQGGVEHHVAEVASRMAGEADVVVLTTDPSGRLPRKEVVDGVRVQRVRAWPKRGDLYFAPGMWRAITHGGWDVVHVQSYHTFVAPLAMLAALSADIPYVVTFHGGGHSSALRRKLRAMQWRILRPLLARAARLIAVARFEAEFFADRLHLAAERFAVIPNGSDLPAAGTLLAPPVSGPLLVSVGRLEEYKGHQRVIGALPWVLREFPETRLLVLGSGPYADELREIAQRLGVADHVEVRAIPSEDRPRMAATLASADLVVLMSEFETHPLAVIEALALGTPALVADTSGLRELAGQGLAKSVPLATEPRALGAAIVEDIRRPRAVPAVALPTWRQCTQALLRVYRSVLDGNALTLAHRRLPTVAGLSGCGLLAIALADNAGRRGLDFATPLYWLGLACIFAPAFAMLLRRGNERRDVLGALAVVGLSLYVVSVLDSPTLFTGFDELLHYRTLDDILGGGRLFAPNPLLPISPYFPGLEVLTHAVVSVTGLSAFSAGVVVVGAARLLGVLSLFLLLERVGLSTRSAGLGVLAYATVPGFLYFQSQYAYESLALPLAVLTLLVLRAAQLAAPALRRRLHVMGALLVLAVAATHHVTSYILAAALLGWLLAWALWHRRQKERAPGGVWVPLLGTLSVVTWFWVFARKTAEYLGPHLTAATSEVLRIVLGQTQGRQLFQGGSGQSSPPLERIVGLVAVALVMALIALGMRRLRGHVAASSLALLLGLSVLAYPASLALRFTQSGWAVGSRATSFVYVGLALVLACGIESAMRASRLRLGPVALTALATVVFAGGVIAGSTTSNRVATPYAPGAGRASIDAEGVDAATWARKTLGPGNRMVADSTNASLMGSYGRQRTLSAADGVSLSWLYLTEGFGDYQRSMVDEAGIEYLVVDRRIAEAMPFQGYFFETWERLIVDYGGVLPSEVVGKFDAIAGADRVFDSGNIQVYDTREVTR